MEGIVGDKFERRRMAVATLVRAVLARFTLDEGQPRFGPRHDPWRWWRHGQEDFVGVRRDAWLMPADLPIIGWLDGFPEMAAVREAYAADPVLASRVDASMGTEFSRSGTNFYWILAQHVIEPLVVATRSYVFDEPIFDNVYVRFEESFRATHLHMIEFCALNGFTSTEDPFLLPDGLAVRRMTDWQMSQAINILAVPRMVGGSVNSARVSHYDQWAIMSMREYPVIAGDVHVASPQPPILSLLDGPAARLVTALRVVCGGSVVATRSMHEQADDEFPFVPSGSAMLNTFMVADNTRPTILSSEAADTVRDAYLALSLPQVRDDKSLQVAIRRLGYAGSRSLDSDRVVDLMTSAEALFLKRAGKQTNAKGAPVAQAAASLVGTDPELNTDSAHLEKFMRTVYMARNAEIHGDDQPYAPLHLLSGEPTTSLALVVRDAEHAMRRAILAVLREHVAVAP